MSGQRARSAVPAELRSAHPGIAGVPWWGAILIAVVACTAGFAVDAGGGALTSVFSVLYVMGCLVAVLAVRRNALFTAVIQPPLLLFITVPGAYFLMHSSDIKGIKDLLINCGYPLIERFPLMFFTSAAVLVLGIARRYLGASPAGHSSAVSAKLSSFVTGERGERGGHADAAEPTEEKPKERRRRHTATKRTETRRDATKPRAERPTRRAAPSRSRHARPPDPTEIIEPVVDLDRPRRRRPRPEDAPTSEPRRRPRPSGQRESGRESARESRVPPSERLGGYERPARRPRYDEYEPRESSTHHPISRVRYRGSDDTDDQEYRPRRRPSRDVDADRWNYDI
ncbi:MAG: hypothetical protein PGN37_14890 [Mycobacterium kyogaense]|uniref:DUF6542 domain-containing protein n=1 Tax=Mycobacterium kyogaense TaxID=2212479 RepID=UPI002FF8D809